MYQIGQRLLVPVPMSVNIKIKTPTYEGTTCRELKFYLPALVQHCANKSIKTDRGNYPREDVKPYKTDEDETEIYKRYHNGLMTAIQLKK